MFEGQGQDRQPSHGEGRRGSEINLRAAGQEQQAHARIESKRAAQADERPSGEADMTSNPAPRSQPDSQTLREKVARIIVPYWLGGFEDQERVEGDDPWRPWKNAPYTPNARAYELADSILEIVAAARCDAVTGPVADATGRREELRSILLKAICNVGERCSCADRNYQWRDHICNVSMAHVDKILDKPAILALAPVQTPPKGDAWQWLGGDLKQGDPDWVAEATEPESSSLSFAVFTGGLTVHTQRGPQRARPRDWIVRIDGEIYLFSESAWAALSRSSTGTGGDK
jgi:hypothetical protein